MDSRPFLGIDLQLRPMLALLLLLCLVACGGGESSGGDSERGAPGANSRSGRAGGSPGGGGPGGPGFGEAAAAVPVEVVSVERSRIASTLTTHGTLEAEKEVDLVARISGPIVRLVAEEGAEVAAGALLARIDPREVAAQLEVSRVQLAEAQADFERTRALRRSNLVSQELFENAQSTLDRIRAEHARNEIQVGYTEIRAPFAGQIVRRYIKDAESVANNQALFRISDFDPLLCTIRVPERELQRLKVGQRALIGVEAFAGQQFEARVVRISPVVEAESGAIKVTLEADPEGGLRPGMFASVALEVESREDALVIPKTALSLDSIGDTVFVVTDGEAQRREIVIGYRQGDRIEVIEGLAVGESVVVLGQDGLADGTPVQVLDGGEPQASGGPRVEPEAPREEMTPEQIERMRERMRSRGLSEPEIEERLQQIREQGFDPRGSRGERGDRGQGPRGESEATEAESEAPSEAPSGSNPSSSGS